MCCPTPRASLQCALQRACGEYDEELFYTYLKLPRYSKNDVYLLSKWDKNITYAGDFRDLKTLACTGYEDLELGEDFLLNIFKAANPSPLPPAALTPHPTSTGSPWGQAPRQVYQVPGQGRGHEAVCRVQATGWSGRAVPLGGHGGEC